ncbi:MAG TPA: glycosyltransferase family 4 protein [Bacteroidales bacterium]|nr:glycosyltransferase family 4 protein [Bacteroidales bacterium]
MKKVAKSIHKKLNNLNFFFTSLFFTNIFIQKVYLPRWEIKIFKYCGKNIIYDFDDAIYVNEQSQAISKNKRKRLDYVLKQADWITVENETNANYAKICGNNNSIIITGPIECNRYFPQENTNSGNEFVIGWIGSPSTTKYLEIVKRPLQILSQTHPNFKLMLIGANDIAIEGVNTENYPWTLDSEVELLRKFDIGIMPLYNDIWCAGKGGYKLLQYMALGIPSIASPVGVNDDILNMGDIGFKAITEEDWIKSFEKLINNKEIRLQMGKKARETALTYFSYEKYVHDLIHCFR